MKTIVIRLAWLVVAGLLLFVVGSAVADSVLLKNGEVIVGRVIELDEKFLRIESETTGLKRIPRGNVASIQLFNSRSAPMLHRCRTRRRTSSPS